MLTEDQKTLLYYALDAVQRTLYYDEDYQRIDYNYNDFRLDVIELNKITSSLGVLHILIDDTLDDLCR